MLRCSVRAHGKEGSASEKRSSKKSGLNRKG